MCQFLRFLVILPDCYEGRRVALPAQKEARAERKELLDFIRINDDDIMFQLNVVSNTPLTPLEHVDDVALQFLKQIGYLPENFEPRKKGSPSKEGIPYRLFLDCFLRNTRRVWLVEELAVQLKTTKPTVYRHLNKLKGFDLVEEVEAKRDGQTKKGYRIRYGDLGKAWSFTEANVEMAMDNYRKTVEHLQKLIEEEK